MTPDGARGAAFRLLFLPCPVEPGVCLAVPGARSAAAPPALRPLRCSRPGPLCLRAVPKYSGKKKKKKDLNSKQLSSCSAAPATGNRQRYPVLPPAPGHPPVRAAPRAPHGPGERGTAGDTEAALGSWGAAGSAPLRSSLRSVHGAGVGAGGGSPSALTAPRPREPAPPGSARSAARPAAEEQREGS